MNVEWGSLVFAALAGSFAILVSMYVLLPALGLPKLDFAAVTGGWVGIAGRYAKLVGVAVFVLGGLAWAFGYAKFWPWHSPVGGMIYALIPFAIASIAMLPELHRFRAMVTPMPGFVSVKAGGPNAILANLVEHLMFGLCLGLFYR
jgi:hypothetical protein